MPMDEKYFDWLYNLVRPEHEAGLGRLEYTKVCALAHQIIFDWSVPNDDNRSADGRELRYEFIQETKATPDETWMRLDASLFEVMVALTRRCDFIAELGLPAWFDIFMGNLELDHYNDQIWVPSDRSRVNRILTKLNERRYRPDGKGGLFPLKNPKKDQREVELWYQMAAYMAQKKMY